MLPTNYLPATYHNLNSLIRWRLLQQRSTGGGILRRVLGTTQTTLRSISNENRRSRGVSDAFLWFQKRLSARVLLTFWRNSSLLSNNYYISDCFRLNVVLALDTTKPAFRVLSRPVLCGCQLIYRSWVLHRRFVEVRQNRRR